MNKILVVLIAMSFLNFFCPQKHFKVLEAKFEEAMGGIPESGKRMNFKIKVLSFKSSDKLSFNELQVNDKESKIKVINNSNPELKNRFDKKDTLLLISSIKKSSYNKGLNVKILYSIRRKCFETNIQNLQQDKQKIYK